MQPRHKARLRETRVLLAIEVHGPGIIYEYMGDLRWFQHNDRDAFMQVRNALRDGGMELAEVMDILGETHDEGCACWRCIGRLHLSALRSWAMRKATDENKDVATD